MLCDVCRNNSAPVSRHHFQHISHHVSQRASRHNSVTSPVLPFVVCLMSLATNLPAFRVSSRLRDLKMCESDSAHPKGFTVRSQHVHRAQRKRFSPQKGSLCDLNMCTAPQRDRFDPPKVRRGIALRSQNAHRATARASRPTQSAQMVHFARSTCAPRHSESDSTHPKCAEGSLRFLKMCTAPQRERFDPPKVRRGFASRSQHVHRATARATSLSQSDVPATKSTPRRQSTAPATTFARKLQSAVPATKFN